MNKPNSKGHRVKNGKQKISCNECVNKCCDNFKIKLRGKKGRKLGKLKTGAKIFIIGITLIKKANGLWKCIAYDHKTGLCKIHPYRPPLCRWFFCEYAKQKGNKKILNAPLQDPLYGLHFNFSFRFKGE